MSGDVSRGLERLGPELPRAHERRLHAEEARTAHVRVHVVRDEPGQLGLRVERVEGGGEVRRARLAEDDRIDARRVLEARDERARVEHRTAARLPPLVLVEAVERRTHLDLVERACKVHVAEDLVGLERLVAAADEHGLGVVAHELETLEVGDDRAHDEGEHALSRELACGRSRCRLQLAVVEREAHLAQLLGEPGARARRVVGDEAESVTRAAKLRDGFRGARGRLPGDVQHAVDVEQNARHGA